MSFHGHFDDHDERLVFTSPDIQRRFRGKHILSVSQFSRQDLDDYIFPMADTCRETLHQGGEFSTLRNKIVTMAFYEPSTRTHQSFSAAASLLGAVAKDIVGMQFSSVSKGETLPDTIRTLACYSQAIVLRHPDEGSVALAAKYAQCPVINAGDGKGEHPTQALLDLYTIRRHLGRIDGQTVTMVGDLKHGRTVHSLARLLTLYEGVKIRFVSPPELRMPPELISTLRGHGVAPEEYDRLDDVIGETNVMYVTRVQKERFPTVEAYEAVKGSYVITPETLARAPVRGKFILMHPLPRVDEISMEVDTDPRAVYFPQVKNGMYVRMALLALVTGKQGARHYPQDH